MFKVFTSTVSTRMKPNTWKKIFRTRLNFSKERVTS